MIETRLVGDLVDARNRGTKATVTTDSFVTYLEADGDSIEITPASWIGRGCPTLSLRTPTFGYLPSECLRRWDRDLISRQRGPL